MGTSLCAHVTSVEGCTFVSSGIQQYELNFVSSKMCILSQMNRLSSEIRIDTLEYSIDWDIISLFPMYIYDEYSSNERQIIPTKYRLDPYVYLDGKAIKCSALGGITAVRHSNPFTFVRSNIGVFLSPSDTLRFEMLAPNFMQVERRISYGLFKLTSGRTMYSYRQLKAKYIRMIRDYFKHYYKWGDYWFSRKKYAGQVKGTLSGISYEYASSPISESLRFLNDSLCVYSLLNSEKEASIEYYCNYSILQGGLVIVRRDSIVSKGGDMKPFIPERKEYSPKYSDLLSVATIDCDTFLLCDDVLYYAKIYPRTAYSYYHKPPMGDSQENSMGDNQETHLLQTKAFVRSDKKRMPVKIGKLYRRYYIPINYTRNTRWRN